MRFVAYLLLALCLNISAEAAAPKDPEGQVETLMKTLQIAKYDGALEAFFAGSYVAQQKPTELKAISGQMKAAFEFYGPPTTWEFVDIKKQGKDLVSIKVLSKHKDEIPLFWNAVFYRRLDQWEPLGIRFFDDPGKAGFY